MGLQQLLLARADFQNQLIHFQFSRMTGIVVIALAAISFFAACYLAIRCLNLFKNDQIEKNKKKISAVIPMKNSIESSGEKKIQGLLKERSIDSSVVFGALNAPNIPLNPPSTIYIGQQAPMQVDLKATSLQSVSSSPPSNHSLKLQEKIDQSLQDLQNRVVTTETLKDCIEVASQLDPKNDDRNKILDLAIPCIEKNKFFVEIAYKTLQEILNYCKTMGNRLTHLDWSWSRMSEDDIAEICKSCPNLQSLFLTADSNITDSSLVHLSSLTSLQSLRLLHAKLVTGQGLTYLNTIKSLRSLDLIGCGLTDAGLQGLSGLTSLEYLTLPNKSFTNAGLAHLSGMTSLQKFEVWSSSDDFEITDEGLKHLRQLTALKHLVGVKLSKDLSDVGLKDLSELVSLQSLVLRDCRHITDKGFGHLRKMTSLKSLKLMDCTNITPYGFQSFFLTCDLQSLESLYFWGCSLSDDSVEYLGKNFLKSLNSLDLYICPGITDAGLKSLCDSAPSLLSLTIRYCKKITSFGCDSLKRGGLKIDYED